MSRNTDLPDVEQGAPVPAFTTGQWPEPAPPADAIDLSGPQRLKPDYFVPPLTIQGPVTSDSFTDVPFDDLPLYIPGLTQNVVGFDGGINKAALEVHRDLGLLCNLLAYLNMAKDDFVELFCDDVLIPVATYNVTQDDVDKSRMIPLYIPRTRLPDGPVNPVFLRVTRLGGTSKETKRFNLKVDTVPPAGRNPIGSTLQNENLPVPVFPEHIINFGVTETDAQNGVPVTFKFYPDDATQEPNTYRATRDRIRLRINGITAPIPPLTESQATGREDITVTLYYGFWQQVRSGSHVCEYEIIDEVGNASLGWSPALRLNVRLNDGSEPLLPKALILEAPNNTLDHDQLNGRDATIFISTPGPDFALGDVVRVAVKGRSSGGVITISYNSPPLTSLSFITLPCPNADLRPFISGQFQLSYERISNGVPNRYSDGNIFNVIGTPIDMRLPPPVVLEAPGGVLDPQSPLVNIVVRAYPDLGQDPFDLVILILEGTYANGTRYYDELYESAGGGDVLFPIANGPNGVIAGLEGGTLRLLYQVDNGDGVRTSMDVTVNVGNAVASLPEPEVMEAPAPLYQFDPEQSTEHANIVVKSNPDFLLNDIVTLYCEGTAPGGTAPAQAFPIRVQWVGRDLRFRLERSYILANIDKTMRIYYTRWRDNVLTRFSHAVNMKVGSKLELKAPTVLEATVTGPDQASLDPLHVLPPNRPVVTIRVVSDKFPPGSDIKVFIVDKPGVGMPNIAAKPATPEPGENYVSFTVPHAFVAAYLADKCTIYYNLIETGKTTKSDELTLEIKALAVQEWDLVSIPEASGGGISAGEKNHVEIRAWHFMDKEQAVFIDLKGPPDWPLRQGRVVSASELAAGRILEPIPSEYLTSLPNNSRLTIQAYVSLDKRGEIISAQPFVEVSYRVSALGLRFVNGPYAVGPAGRLGDVQLLLGTNTKAPVAITLTLPAGFTFEDGTSGSKAFLSDESGALKVEGIRSIGDVGTYALKAISGVYSASSEIVVRALLPAGSVINLRGEPSKIAVTPSGLYAYVCVTSINRLVKVDLASGEVKEIIIGGGQKSVSCSTDGKKVCVTLRDSLVVIDTKNDEIISSIAISTSNGISDGNFSPDGKYLYTSSQNWTGSGYVLRIYRIDVASEMIIREYTQGQYTIEAFCSANGQNIYTVGYGNGYLYRVDIETGGASIVGTFTKGNYAGFIMSPYRDHMYSCSWENASSGTAFIFDLVSGQRKTHRLPYTYIHTYAASPGNNRLLIGYGPNGSSTAKALIDTQTGATINTYNITGNIGAHFSWKGDTLYLCETNKSRISVISIS
ncbi:hypothetical protein YA0852_02895 [Pseudomonas synxantha]|uniref:YncE family protein n=1 Tax=Pseudomonas synxantha TaxID=47883 RepID=A0ABS0UF53_9PSED|nr:hypothetical protein [Pseudomonas synxantha]MBI6563063.1 hypothetical protein [Pseudomonas synxantha]MBI6583033.1 hypothetical protein [Pseudomonas synxantha]